MQKIMKGPLMTVKTCMQSIVRQDVRWSDFITDYDSRSAQWLGRRRAEALTTSTEIAAKVKLS